MRYAILIFEKADVWANVGTAEAQANMGDHHTFMTNNQASLRGGEALQPASTATRIEKDIVTDGPFVDSKEALGGFYIIEAADLDEAIAIAKQVPAPHGGVEVRPIWELGG